MDHLELRQKLDADKSVFINDVRDYVQAQRALWQRVPWLALFADDGLGGPRGNDYSFAYYTGQWRIRDPLVHPTKLISVDCATGELVYSGGPRELATDNAIFRISGKLDLVDATLVIRQLIWEARRPFGLSAPTGHESVDEWRNAILARTGLTEIYHRPVLK